MSRQSARHGRKKRAKTEVSGFWKRTWVRRARLALLVIAGLLAAVVAGFLVVFYTPFFPAARTQYILMTLHTSNPWLATTFFSQETIQRVVEENKVEAPDGNTDPGLIRIGGSATASSPPESGPSSPTAGTATSATTSAAATATKITTAAKETRPTGEAYKGTVIHRESGMDIVQIPGDGFMARLIRVSDPSRVSLGLTKTFLGKGEKLPAMSVRLGAAAGINAGGFDDPGGHGAGGTPTYLCVKDYKIVYTDGAKTHKVIGFNENNVLVLGEFTDEQVLEKRVRDAVAFGPFLIVNGKKAKTSGAAGGRDPRAAIGQTADGTVLLLTVDGRQLGMEGANMRDIMEILWEYGAVNAANLDGGSSATMVLNGKVINKTCGPAGARYLPNAWLVF